MGRSRDIFFDRKMCQVVPNLIDPHLLRVFLIVKKNILPDIANVCTFSFVAEMLQTHQISYLVE